MVPLTNAQISYLDGVYDANQYNNGSSNTWQVLTNTPEAVSNSNINMGSISILLNNLASNTTVTIDEIKVSEYDQSNNFIKDVFFDDFSTSNFGYQFNDEGTGTTSTTRVQDSTNGGYAGDGAKVIQGPTGPNINPGVDDVTMSGDWNTGYFKIDPNNKYQISIRVKIQNPGPNTKVSPMIGYFHGDGFAPLNKSFIEAAIQPYIDYSSQKNVPIFMGEYGADNWDFKELKNVSDGTLYTNLGNLGGEQYVNDVLSIISDNKLNSSYWSYCTPSTEDFGLYGGDINNPKTYINEALENAFTKYFVDQAPQFFSTSGKDIIDPATGEPYIIKAMNLQNDVWDYGSEFGGPTTPSGVDYALTAVTESDYQKMQELGVNSVRFCLSYKFFDDNRGFQLIDQNIVWAKKYGISIILDMHITNGGEQCSLEGMTLWTDANNQNDLIALWVSIANRYKNEPIIIGYDLVNEPVPVKLDSETIQQALDKWTSLASRIATGIRSVDSNHILFVEPAISTSDIDGNTDWSLPSRIFIYRNSI